MDAQPELEWPWSLRDPELLRILMKNPGRGWKYSVRDLAEAAGCSHGTIGNLLTGVQGKVESDLARRIAGAVGVAILVLFMPPTSVDSDGSSTRLHEVTA